MEEEIEAAIGGLKEAVEQIRQVAVRLKSREGCTARQAVMETVSLLLVVVCGVLPPKMEPRRGPWDPPPGL